NSDIFSRYSVACRGSSAASIAFCKHRFAMRRSLNRSSICDLCTEPYFHLKISGSLYSPLSLLRFPATWPRNTNANIVMMVKPTIHAFWFLRNVRKGLAIAWCLSDCVGVSVEPAPRCVGKGDARRQLG